MPFLVSCGLYYVTVCQSSKVNAEKFDCGKSQIQCILARRAEILDEYSANKNALNESK